MLAWLRGGQDGGDHSRRRLLAQPDAEHAARGVCRARRPRSRPVPRLGGPRAGQGRVDRPRARPRRHPVPPRGEPGRHRATRRRAGRRRARRARGLGDDQGEWFSADSQPALCIYWGDTVENLPPAPREDVRPRSATRTGASTATARTGRSPSTRLGRHLVEQLTHEHEFDVAHARVQPRHGPFGHAWGFVHQRLMGERPIPIVPVCSTPTTRRTSRRRGAATSSAARSAAPSRLGRSRGGSASSRRAGSATSWSTRRSTATCSTSSPGATPPPWRPCRSTS